MDTLACVKEVNAVDRAVAVANEIVQGTVLPYDGAKTLWMMSRDLEELAEALRVFIGLASEWEDAPNHRTAYERDIVVEADRFMSRFGR